MKNINASLSLILSPIDLTY